MKKLINFLVKEFLYNGHLQSLGGAGIVLLSTKLYFPNAVSFWMIVSIYTLFQPIYYFDRFRDIKKDYITNRARTKHLKSYVKYMPMIIGLLFASYVLITILYANTYSLLFGITVSVLGLAYPIYAKNVTKYIPLFKNIYVALVHGLLVVYPFIYLGKLDYFSVTVMYTSLFVFVEAMIMQVLLDSKDIYADKKKGLMTLPVLVGDKATLVICLATSLFTFVIFGLYYQKLVSILVFSLVINFMAIHWISQKQKKGYILSAAKFLLWFCALIIVNM